jgi:hypothetical protein
VAQQGNAQQQADQGKPGAAEHHAHPVRHSHRHGLGRGGVDQQSQSGVRVVMFVGLDHGHQRALCLAWIVPAGGDLDHAGADVALEREIGPQHLGRHRIRRVPGCQGRGGLVDHGGGIQGPNRARLVGGQPQHGLGSINRRHHLNDGRAEQPHCQRSKAEKENDAERFAEIRRPSVATPAACSDLSDPSLNANFRSHSQNMTSERGLSSKIVENKGFTKFMINFSE